MDQVSVELGHKGMGIQWDTKGWGLRESGTQRDGDTTQLRHKGTRKQGADLPCFNHLHTSTITHTHQKDARTFAWCTHSNPRQHLLHSLSAVWQWHQQSDPPVAMSLHRRCWNSSPVKEAQEEKKDSEHEANRRCSGSSDQTGCWGETTWPLFTPLLLDTTKQS